MGQAGRVMGDQLTQAWVMQQGPPKFLQGFSVSDKRFWRTRGGQGVFTFSVGRAWGDPARPLLHILPVLLLRGAESGAPRWGGIHEFEENEGEVHTPSTRLPAFPET